MVLNRRLMSLLSEKDVVKILRSGKYDDYLATKVNRNSESHVTKCADLALFDAFDHHMANYLLNKPGVLDKNLVIKYRDYLYAIFKQMPTIVFESILFNREIVGAMFTKEQQEEIQKYKKESTIQCKEVYDKIRSGQRITREENTLLFQFLLKNIENEDSNVIHLLDDIYMRLLKGSSIKSLQAKEFVLKYTAHLARRDLHIPPVEVYLSNTDLGGSSYSNYNYGTSYGNTSVISVNKDLVARNVSPIADLPSIIKFMQTVCHETRHSSQAYRAEINDLSYESFEWIRTQLFRNYLSKENFNEYNVNYRHNEIERDANLYGWMMTEKLLNKYAPQRKKEIESVIDKNIREYYNEALANKRDTTRRMPKEYYNVKMMDDIVRKYPVVLNQYPQLTHVYKSNGTRKSFMELVHTNERLVHSTGDSEMDKVFYDYFLEDIKRGELSNIDVESLNVEEQFSYFKRLVSIVIEEIKRLKRSIDILSSNNVSDFENINRERVHRIVNLINYMNGYQDLINSLIRMDVSQANKRMFGMQMRFVDENLGTLKHHLKKNPIIENVSLYDELKNIAGGEVHGPHL